MDVKLGCTLGACDSASRSPLGRRMSWGPLFSDFGVSKAGSAVITRRREAAGRELGGGGGWEKVKKGKRRPTVYRDLSG